MSLTSDGYFLMKLNQMTGLNVAWINQQISAASIAFDTRCWSVGLLFVVVRLEGKIQNSGETLNCFGFLPEQWEEVAVDRNVWASLFKLLPPSPTNTPTTQLQTKRQMDERIDGFYT